MATSWRIGNGSFKGFTFHVAIPAAGQVSGVTSQEIQTERRLQISEKPGLDGAEVEDFGRKPIVASCEVIFYTNDYISQLEQFEAILNQGTTGILVLPDLPRAINAKFRSESRRTSVETATILSLSFIEDIGALPTSTNALTTGSAVTALSTNNPAAAIPTINNRANAVIAAANAASALLTNNPLISAINSANSAVVNASSTINSVLNVPRTLRQTILGLAATTQNNLNNLKSITSALQGFANLLNQTTDSSGNVVAVSSFSSAATTLTPVDFAKPVTATASTVNGLNQIVTPPTLTGTVSSLPDAKTQLKAALSGLQANRQSLETSTSGNTKDYTASSIAMENKIQDLINLITPPPPVNVFSPITQSLAEICFANGLKYSDADYVYKANLQLTDILAIPAYTVVSLPTGIISV